jgi:hypothetical protein
LGLAPIDVCVGAGFTVRLVVPLDPEKLLSPEYKPEIVSVPPGAAVELQEPLPPDSVAVQSDVDPDVKVTDPLGAGSPVVVVVTVVEYVTDDPSPTGLGSAVTDVCVGALLTTSVVVPVEDEPLPPEYVPNTRSLPIGAEVALHEPLPLDSVAEHSDVDPVENVTEPPPPPPLTVAE